MNLLCKFESSASALSQSLINQLEMLGVMPDEYLKIIEQMGIEFRTIADMARLSDEYIIDRLRLDLITDGPRTICNIVIELVNCMSAANSLRASNMI